MPKYGRVPSPPDERDFNLAHFMGDEDILQQLLDQMLAAKGANPKVKAWAKEATARILGNPIPPAPTPTPTPQAVEWANPRPVLDQGDYGTCVGNGWAQWGNSDPVNDSYIEDDARAIYYDATVYDGAPDTTYQQGATVRSGAKAMVKRQRLQVYASAQTLDDALQWILTKGTIVFGTDFTYGMESPDSAGLVHPTGGVAGGHCYLGVGYDPSSQKIKFLNSWGTSWGVNGYFYMFKNEFEQLYADNGEAWAAVELPLI